MSHQSRLRWQCRRGTKELDLLLVRYLENVYPTASAEEQRCFEDLLAMQDPELYDYLIGRLRPDDKALASVVNRIISHD